MTDYGVIQGKHYRTNSSAPLQICCAQTLAVRRVRPTADIVFIDECHWQSKFLIKWISDEKWRDVPFIGLSATPWSSGMGKHWNVLLKPVSIPELQAQNVLVKALVMAPPPPDLSGVHVRHGDYIESELAAVCNRPELVGNVIETWLKHASDRPTLVYAVDRAHAKHLHERFCEAGINSEYVDGRTLMFDREDMFKRFASGETQVICSINTLDIGLDLPPASCISMCRPTKSRIFHVQSLGRGLTAHPGKQDCLILDHAGNVLRLGMLDEISSDVLDDGDLVRSAERQPEKEPKEAKLCPECHAVQQPVARECWQCGHVFYAVTLVKEREGELVEFPRDRIKPRPGALLVSEMFEKPEPRDLDKRLWHAGLLGLAEEARQRGKNWSPYWAGRNFKEKFGHYPPWSWQNDMPVNPSVECRNWVRSKQISYAKRMQ
jgi:DNA repair protein RadD